MTKTKLNKIIAVSNAKKSQARSRLQEAYHLFQKATTFNGLNRTYRAANEDGEQLPPEVQRVQNKVEKLTDKVLPDWVDMFDVVLSQDTGNCQAKADIVVDGKTVLTGVPVTTLIFLEKSLQDIHTLVSKMPTLDPTEDWEYNQETGFYESSKTQKQRTKKVEKPVVLYEATKEHPAQTKMVTTDEVVGYWSENKNSGAIPQTKKEEMLGRVDRLREAVINAREEANSIEVENRKGGEDLVKYIFES